LWKEELEEFQTKIRNLSKEEQRIAWKDRIQRLHHDVRKSQRTLVVTRKAVVVARDSFSLEATRSKWNRNRRAFKEKISQQEREQRRRPPTAIILARPVAVEEIGGMSYKYSERFEGRTTDRVEGSFPTQATRCPEGSKDVGHDSQSGVYWCCCRCGCGDGSST